MIGRIGRHLRAERRLWFKVHLYLGLGLGLFLSVIGVTGSILVFWMEMDEWLNPAWIRVEPAPGAMMRPLEELASVARAAIPAGATLSEFNWPRHPRAAAMVEYRVPNRAAGAKPDSFHLFLNPYTGHITGRRLWYSAETWWKNPLLGILFKLHYALMIPSWGTYLVGGMTFFFVLLTVTGVYVWWPLSGKWRQALQLRLTWRSPPRLNFELHKTTGFYSVLVLTVVLITGIYLDWPELVEGLLQQVTAIEPAPGPRIPVPPGCRSHWTMPYPKRRLPFHRVHRTRSLGKLAGRQSCSSKWCPTAAASPDAATSRLI